MDWEIELRLNFLHHALERQKVEQKHAKKSFTRHKIYHTDVRVTNNLAPIHDFLY